MYRPCPAQVEDAAIIRHQNNYRAAVFINEVRGGISCHCSPAQPSPWRLRNILAKNFIGQSPYGKLVIKRNCNSAFTRFSNTS